MARVTLSANYVPGAWLGTCIWVTRDLKEIEVYKYQGSWMLHVIQIEFGFLENHND